MSIPNQSTQIQLVARPTGRPTHDDFRKVVVDLPELGADEVRVVNDFVSVDPYMRGRMNDAKSYIAPFELDATMDGAAVGHVVASTTDAVPVGSVVAHNRGWRDVAQGPAKGFRVVEEAPGLPRSALLGILGMTGLTAYVGLGEIARLAMGDTVFVSGAAGAVGTAVGQIARRKGATRVIGSAGSAEKVALLTERYGFDAAINYKDGPIREQLAEVVGDDGVDVYFDNVGGDHLEAALDVMNRFGRVAVCGAISGYNATDRTPGPDNLTNIVTRSLTLRGFTLGDHFSAQPAFEADMRRWIAEGRIVHDETVVEGIDNAVDAFLSLLDGGNTGKMVVKTS